MRVLVIFEENYRVYADTLVHVIRALRLHVECSVAEVDGLEGKIVRLNPHVVISNLPKDVVGFDDRRAWLELPRPHSRPAKLCLEGQDTEVDNPGLKEQLRIMDEIERRC